MNSFKLFILAATLSLFSFNANAQTKPKPAKTKVQAITQKSTINLANALKEGNTEAVQTYLNAGDDPNSKIGMNGESPLGFLLRKGNTEIAKIFINAKGIKLDDLSDYQDTCKYSRTPIMLAVAYPEIVKLLIEKGINLDIQDAQGRTALMWATDSLCVDSKRTDENTEVVKLLVNKGVNLNIQDINGSTALMKAASGNMLKTAKIMLEKEPNLELYNKNGYTALMLASMYGNTKIVKLLLDKGAKIATVDKTGYTALMYSANPAITKLLIERGAKIDAQDQLGFTPFMYACGVPANLKKAELLLSKGADINLPNKTGITPLMYAAQKEESFETVKFLLKKGAAINLQDTLGKTALIHAAEAKELYSGNGEKYTEIVKLLLDKGAKIDIQDKEGHTALWAAQRYGRKITADFLLAKGANPTKQFKKTDDKRNVTYGIVGTWELARILKYPMQTKKIVFNPDYSCQMYNRKSKTASWELVEDIKAYDFENDLLLFIHKNAVNPGIYNWKIAGNTLTLNEQEVYKKVK